MKNQQKKTRMFNKLNGIRVMALALFAFTFFSCSSDDDAVSNNNDPQEDLYAVYWRVNTPDGRTNYVSLVNEIMSGSVDASQALEVSGKSRFFAPENADYFVIGDGENLTFTRYNINQEDQSIEQGESFSLSNQGVTKLQKRNVFLSETKAYYIDNTQGQIVIWNPEEMVITGSFDLPAEFADGYQGFSTQLGFGDYQVNGNQMLIPVGWVNFANNTHLDKTGLAVVDVENDQVLSYNEDTRCALAVEPAFMPNGDVYYGVSERYHFSTEARENEDCGCILKVAAGANDFDQDYDPNFMNQIEGKKVGIGLTNSPKMNHGYVKVLDTSILPWSPDVEAINYYGLVWETYEINLPENEIIRKVDRPLAPSYSENLYTFDGIQYGAIKVSDDEQYKVIEYNTDGSYVEGLDVPGYISNMQRLHKAI